MESGVISGYGFQAFFDRTLTSGCSVGFFCVGTPEVLAQSVDVHPSFQLLNFIIFSELYWTYAAGSAAASMAVLVCLAVCSGSLNKEKERARLYARKVQHSIWICVARMQQLSNELFNEAASIGDQILVPWQQNDHVLPSFFYHNSLKLTILTYAKIFRKRQQMSRARGKCDSLFRIFWNFQQMFF